MTLTSLHASGSVRLYLTTVPTNTNILPNGIKHKLEAEANGNTKYFLRIGLK